MSAFWKQNTMGLNIILLIMNIILTVLSRTVTTLYLKLKSLHFFSKAALSILPVIGFKPDLIHCHDWQTGLIPVYLHERFAGGEFYRGIKTSYDDP